jgi:(heptosyl)LPS beta-1,4-glucosyltransferase
MNGISGIVIAKNEENMIADCLDSLAFCSELVVVDNGSQDRTAEIAKRMGARVYSLEIDDFSRLRNFGLEKARGEWVLYVDADERISPTLREALIQLTSNPINKNEGFFIKRKNFYLGNNEWPYIEKLERFFKKRSLKKWEGRLHESPVVFGEIGEIEEGFLLHYTHRDLSSMLKKTIEWSGVEAQLRFDARHPKVTWWRLIRVMITAFFDSYIRQSGWKAGPVGIIESIYQSFSIFITYARLWEMQNAKVKITN